jgi:hypothetical protein
VSTLKFLALVVCSVLAAIAMVGCAPGYDGLRQSCANTDAFLTGGYKLATASMKAAKSNGTAKQLLGCFQDFVGALDAGAKVKEGMCASAAASTDYASDAAAVMTAGASVATAVSNWQKCSARALASGML